jgi:hypothetical protein
MRGFSLRSQQKAFFDFGQSPKSKNIPLFASEASNIKCNEGNNIMWLWLKL